MKPSLLFVQISLLAVFLISQYQPCTGQDSPGVNNAGFEAWLWNTLEKYPEWVSENSMDPSPVSQGPVDLHVDTCLLQLNWQIRNYSVWGFTDNMTVTRTSSYFPEQNQFELRFRNGREDQNSLKITFEGDYTANGTVLSTIPINGSGKWKLTFGFMIHLVEFYNFTISPEGFLALSEGIADLQYLTSPENLVEFDFEGLINENVAGYAETIKIIVVDNLWDLLADYHRGTESYFPGWKPLFQYFQHMFQTTPWTEIIGTPATSTTQIPTTPTGPTTPSTSPRTTPSGPCMDLTSDLVEAARKEVELYLDDELIQLLLRKFPKLWYRLGPNRKWLLKTIAF